MPTASKPGECRNLASRSLEKECEKRLPEDYTCVPAVAFKPNSVSLQQREYNWTDDEGIIDSAKEVEQHWISEALQLLDKDLTNNDSIVWAAFHSKQQPYFEHLPAIIQLLPLFYEKSATAAMIKHGMNVIKKATEFLNPGQIPVTTFDHPLYAIAKSIQWKWPEMYGESQYVVMLGGLHAEMALWKTVGDILKTSGLTTCSSG